MASVLERYLRQHISEGDTFLWTSTKDQKKNI
jgi:hypothetical protein